MPTFDLTEMQCTTHCIAPLVIVNGPARVHCGGFASGFGVMGPGHRANAAVGRALRLAMQNVGGARPGESDMALHGSPAKFGFCIAEDEESSPFPPLHMSLGYAAQDSVVTVVGVESPHSTFFTGDADDPIAAESLIDTLAAVIANRGSNNSHLGGRAAVVVVLNPDHAEVLRRADYGRPRLQAALAARAVTPRPLLAQVNPKMLTGTEDLIPAVRDPANIHVLTAGGPGLYSMVIPSWCAGPHGNVAVHERIEFMQYCDLRTQVSR